MFDIAFNAQISKVSISVKGGGGMIRRICKITLAKEFDAMVAAGLGPDAKDALAALKSGGIESVTMPIGAIEAHGSLICRTGADGPLDEVKIGAMKGVKAKARADKKYPDMPPGIALEFAFEWNEQAWVFLGRHCEAWADITLVRRQLGQMEFGANVTPIKGAPKGSH